MHLVYPPRIDRPAHIKAPLLFRLSIPQWCSLISNRGEETSFNIKPLYFCSTLIHIHVTVLVMLFAECSTDLMNTSVSGKQGNMKEQHSPRHTVSNFNYLSGERVFTCLSKQI